MKPTYIVFISLIYLTIAKSQTLPFQSLPSINGSEALSKNIKYINLADSFYRTSNKISLLKSTKSLKVLTDSSYGFNFKSLSDSVLIDKSFNTYDSEGNMILNVHMSFDTLTKKWTNSNKTEYFKSKNYSMMASYSWNKLSALWVGDMKDEIFYNDQGQYQRTCIHRWDKVLNNWYKYKKGEQLYAVNGYINIYSDSIWNTTDKIWTEHQKDEFYFDEKNQDTLKINYSLDYLTNKLVPYGKYRYTYFENGKRKNYSYFYWDETNNDWLESLRTDYNIDTLKKLFVNTIRWDATNKTWNNSEKAVVDTTKDFVLSINYTWNNKSNQWYQYSKTERGSVVLYQDTLYAYYKWDTLNKKWIGNYKREVKYNTFGNTTLFIVYSWDKISEQWITSTKSEYIYDSDENQTMYASYKWNKKNSQWNAIYKNYSFMSNHDLGNKLNNYTQIKSIIYPNPVSSIINIELADDGIYNCSIINMNGQIIKSLIVYQGTNSINISNIETGIYFIQINSQQGKIMHKFIKE